MTKTKKVVITSLAVAIGIGVVPSRALAAPATQRFTILLGSDAEPVIAVGPVQGLGVLQTDSHQIGPDWSVLVLNRFVFNDGSLSVTFTGQAELRPTSECVIHTSVTGTFQVTGGTGRYTGASGAGTFTDHGTFVMRRGPEGCSDDGIFRATIRATGTTTVPES